MQQTIKQEVSSGLIRPAIAVVCFIIGCAFVDITGVVWAVLFSAGVLGCIAGAILLRSRYVGRDSVSIPILQQHLQSEEIANFVQDLFSPYAQCAAAAAEKLGEIGDAGVVPSLISVLDRIAWRDDSAWEPVCESIVQALALIGDGRALPALNRVSGARGARFRAVVDTAIASVTDMSRLGGGRPEIRPIQEFGQIGSDSGAGHERVAVRRIALVPLGDESAFLDSVSL